jgi:hypothetical protein
MKKQFSRGVFSQNRRLYYPFAGWAVDGPKELGIIQLVSVRPYVRAGLLVLILLQ